MRNSIPKELHFKNLFINKLDMNPKINKIDVQIDKQKKLLTIRNMRSIYYTNEIVYVKQNTR